MENTLNKEVIKIYVDWENETRVACKNGANRAGKCATAVSP